MIKYFLASGNAEDLEFFLYFWVVFFTDILNILNCFIIELTIIIQICVLCAQHASVDLVNRNECSNQDIDHALFVMGNRRIDVAGDGHCLINCWANGLDHTKYFIKDKLRNELIVHEHVYKSSLINTTVEQLATDYIEKRIYSKDKMDILLNALCNAFHADVNLYELRDNNMLVNKITAGRVSASKTIICF